MNYKKISKFIKDMRHLVIYNSGSEQWIGDGIAIFPVIGMPFMQKNEMLTFLGLDDAITNVEFKDAPKWFCEMMTYDDDCPIIEKRGPVLYREGVPHRSYYTEDGAIIIKEKYIQFIENDLKDEPLMLLLVDVHGIPAVGVYRGFDLWSVIMPVKDDNMITCYQQLVDMLHIAAMHKKGTGNNESEEN